MLRNAAIVLGTIVVLALGSVSHAQRRDGRRAGRNRRPGHRRQPAQSNRVGGIREHARGLAAERQGVGPQNEH